MMFDDSRRVRGRVHATVRPPPRGGVNLPRLSPPRPGDLTPGITRRPTSLAEHDSLRVGGRVHAVVMRLSWQILINVIYRKAQYHALLQVCILVP